MTKRLSILIFVLILVILLAGGYLYILGYFGKAKNTVSTSNMNISNPIQAEQSESKKPTSQTAQSATSPLIWNTYNNMQQGYSINYPEGIDILDTTSTAVNFVLDKAIGANLDEVLTKNPYEANSPTVPAFIAPWSGPELTLFITTQNIGESTTLIDWIQKNELSGHGAISPSSEQETTIGGVPAYLLTYDNGNAFDEGNYTAIQYFALYKDKIFIFHGLELPEDLTKVANDPDLTYVKAYVPLMQKMIGSFKFTQ